MISFLKEMSAEYKINLLIMYLFLLTIYILDWQAYLIVITAIFISEIMLVVFEQIGSYLREMVVQYERMIQLEEENKE